MITNSYYSFSYKITKSDYALDFLTSSQNSI